MLPIRINTLIIIITALITTLFNTGFALYCIDCPNVQTITLGSYRSITSPICPAGSTMVLDRFTVLSDNMLTVYLRKTTSPHTFDGPSLLPIGQIPLNYIKSYATGFDVVGDQMNLLITCASASCTVQYGYNFSCKTTTGANWWYEAWGDQCYTECYQRRVVVCRDNTGMYLPDSACASTPKPPTEIVCMTGNCILDENAFRWVPSVILGVQHPHVCGMDCILRTPYDCLDHNGLVTLPKYCNIVTPAPTMSVACGSCDASVLRWVPNTDWSVCDSSCTSRRNVSCHNNAFTVDNQLCINSNIPTLATTQSCSGGCCAATQTTPVISTQIAGVVGAISGLLVGSLLTALVLRHYIKKVDKSANGREQPYVAMHEQP